MAEPVRPLSISEYSSPESALADQLLDHVAALQDGQRTAVDVAREMGPWVSALLGDGAPAGPSTGPLESWTLGELLQNPELLREPAPVIPRLAWMERVTMLSAREKRGKTTLVAHGAAAASRGRPFLGICTAPVKILWVYYEGHHADLVRLLSGAEADSERMIIARGRPGEWAPLVERIHLERPACVVIDTLGSFAAGGLVREFSRPEEWTAVMNRFGQLATESHCGIVLIHHDKKTGGYADSRAIGAGADMLLNVPGEPDDASPKRELKGIGRWPFANCSIRLEAGALVLEDGVAGTPPMEIRILDFVRDHPNASKRTVREELGGRKDDVDAAVTRLLARGLLENAGNDTHHKYRVAQSVAGDDALATLWATGVASVANVAGQRLSDDPATPVARGGPPIGRATATVATENGAKASARYPCPGGCGTTFSAPITTACHACRAKAANGGAR